jgi:LmbE family N-acetylglucosaminyl deacetylase
MNLHKLLCRATKFIQARRRGYHIDHITRSEATKQEVQREKQDVKPFMWAGAIGVLAAVFLIRNGGFEGLYNTAYNKVTNQQTVTDEKNRYMEK